MNPQPCARASYRRTIVAGVAGNLMEWYDFAGYGYMVPVIGRLFFPSDDPAASIIATFGAFAAGYFARPVGGEYTGSVTFVLEHAKPGGRGLATS